MIESISSDPGARVAGPRRSSPPEGVEHALSVQLTAAVTPIPASPPPEALEAVAMAAQTLAELASRDVTLHLDLTGGAGHLRVKVVDGEGSVVDSLTPQRTFELLSRGEGDPFFVDTTG
jgi:hypothetical protein